MKGSTQLKRVLHAPNNKEEVKSVKRKKTSKKEDDTKEEDVMNDGDKNKKHDSKPKRKLTKTLKASITAKIPRTSKIPATTATTTKLKKKAIKPQRKTKTKIKPITTTKAQQHKETTRSGMGRFFVMPHSLLCMISLCLDMTSQRRCATVSWSLYGHFTKLDASPPVVYIVDRKKTMSTRMEALKKVRPRVVAWEDTLSTMNLREFMHKKYEKNTQALEELYIAFGRIENKSLEWTRTFKLLKTLSLRLHHTWYVDSDVFKALPDTLEHVSLTMTEQDSHRRYMIQCANKLPSSVRSLQLRDSWNRVHSNFQYGDLKMSSRNLDRELKFGPQDMSLITPYTLTLPHLTYLDVESYTNMVYFNYKMLVRLLSACFNLQTLNASVISVPLLPLSSSSAFSLSSSFSSSSSSSSSLSSNTSYATYNPSLLFTFLNLTSLRATLKEENTFLMLLRMFPNLSRALFSKSQFVYVKPKHVDNKEEDGVDNNSDDDDEKNTDDDESDTYRYDDDYDEAYSHTNDDDSNDDNDDHDDENQNLRMTSSVVTLCSKSQLLLSSSSSSSSSSSPSSSSLYSKQCEPQENCAQHLHTLDFSHCNNIVSTVKLMTHLNFPTLTALDFTRSRFNKKAAEYFASLHFPQLKVLSLAYVFPNTLYASKFFLFYDYANLLYLNIMHPQTRKQKLWDFLLDQFTQHMPRLRYIHVPACSIKILTTYLPRLKELRELNLARERSESLPNLSELVSTLSASTSLSFHRLWVSQRTRNLTIFPFDTPSQYMWNKPHDALAKEAGLSAEFLKECQLTVRDSGPHSHEMRDNLGSPFLYRKTTFPFNRKFMETSSLASYAERTSIFDIIRPGGNLYSSLLSSSSSITSLSSVSSSSFGSNSSSSSSSSSSSFLCPYLVLSLSSMSS